VVGFRQMGGRVPGTRGYELRCAVVRTLWSSCLSHGSLINRLDQLDSVLILKLSVHASLASHCKYTGLRQQYCR
jgi:hypothetical protein